MDKHGKVTSSPLKESRGAGGRRSTAQKAEQIRSKNQSVLTPATEGIEMGGKMYKTLENRSQRRKKSDKGVPGVE